MRTPALFPSFTLSTSGSSMITGPALPAIALMSGLDGLDVDLSHGLTRLRLEYLSARTAATGVAVRSVWLPPPLPPHPKGRWFGRREQQGWALVQAGSVDTVVVERMNPTPARAGMVPLDLVNLRRLVPSKTQIAIGLRSRDLEGTRDHLFALAALRRYAEEWDFQLALDVSGRIDPAWEVEAALMRLLPRLALVRLRWPLCPHAQHGPDCTTARTVATLKDLRFTGNIAIVPSVGMWQRWWGPAIAEATRVSAGALRERFATVQHPMEFKSFRERPNLL